MIVRPASPSWTRAFCGHQEGVILVLRWRRGGAGVLLLLGSSGFFWVLLVFFWCSSGVLLVFFWVLLGSSDLGVPTRGAPLPLRGCPSARALE